MKRVAIVAAHFPPSNLAGVHRARLWAQHLDEYGWEPIIVTTHWRHYEEPLDWDLASLVDPKLRVIRTPALPVRPVRLIGDIGVRALWWHLQALKDLVRKREVDFVHVTVPSFYSGVLGELLYRRAPLPFGLDYIDPWVHVWPEAERVGSKAWVSMKLGERLEPFAVKNARLITAVAPGYFAGVLDRHPHLKDRAVAAAMPYGNSEADYRNVRERDRPTFLFDPRDGLFHFVYAGAMLPRGYAVLERLFAALANLRDTDRPTLDRMRLHFVGTGKHPSDPNGHNILPYIRRHGLDPWASETPERIPYLDVLNHLAKASAILIVGSTEPHYTPSKVFQAIEARKPIFALLHENSTALKILNASRAGAAVPLTERELPDPDALARRIRDFAVDPGYHPDAVDWRAFDAFSARNTTRMLAEAMDEALARFKSRSRTSS